VYSVEILTFELYKPWAIPGLFLALFLSVRNVKLLSNFNSQLALNSDLHIRSPMRWPQRRPHVLWALVRSISCRGAKLNASETILAPRSDGHFGWSVQQAIIWSSSNLWNGKEVSTKFRLSP